MLKRNKQELLLAVTVLLFITAGLLFFRQELPDQPPYLSSSADRDGVKGLALLLREAGTPVKEWRQPGRALPMVTGHTLIVVQPLGSLTNHKQQLEAWAEQGNHLIVFDQQPSEWNGFRARESKEAEAVKTAASEKSPLSLVKDVSSNGSREYEAAIRSSYRLTEAEGTEALLADQYGVVAARRSAGSGSVTLLVTPEWVLNETILEHSHFELVWPLLKGEHEAVWFDEYAHGFTTKPGLLALYPDWFLLVTLQLVLACALWLWLKAVRMGPAYTPREWTVRRGDETLIAIAGWYERRKQSKAALAHQESYIRSLMRERWGIRPDASDGQVLKQARQYLDKSGEERLESLLAGWREAQAAPFYSVKSFVQDSRKADEIIRILKGE